jgi:putative intracellular protease/amidase
MNVGIFLFEDFETLDVFGPVEILGRLKDLYKIKFYSTAGGQINNHHGVSVTTEKLNVDNNDIDIFIVPGGPGTRKEIDNPLLIDGIRQLSNSAKYVFTICTGSALLAKTGLLNGKRATSNKRTFSWATSTNPNVNWIKHARWTTDGKYYTSSGVSAGMDMTLGFLSDIHGADFARKTAFEIEYRWMEDKDNDPFCDQ